mmetsp:Transcript_29229/g.48293  ORF Transcript_29229/g.48293 Transcript_29229/m.48293 type:complete len:249 (-) Transcript_29229:85-831(-)
MKRKFKSVSFNEQANEVFPIRVDTSQEYSSWNTFDDLADMKQASIQQALAIRQEHAHSLVFLHNNNNTAAAATTYSNTMLEVYLACRTADGPSPKLLRRLAVWHANAPTRRGLEFQSVQTVRIERYKQRLKARQAILLAQDELFLHHRQSPPDDRDMRTPDPMDLLRQASEVISAPSKAFARTLAEADALSLNDNLNLTMEENAFCNNTDQQHAALVNDCQDYQGLAMMLLKARQQYAASLAPSCQPS